MTWIDTYNDGFLETSEGYDYRITEGNVAPYHVETVGGEYKLADKCSLVPCTSFDSDGFPDDWGGHSRYDEVSTPTVDESTLGACCGATENKYCFEIYHFSTYAFADPNCLDESLDRAKLRVLKLNKEIGDQKVVCSAEIAIPVAVGGTGPEPAIDPLLKGFQISVIDTESAQKPTLRSARVEPGAYDSISKTGWKVNKAGTSWVYKGRDRVDGILKVVIKSLCKKQADLLKVKVVAKDTAVPVLTGPVQAEISLDPSGFLDRCATTCFSEPPSENFCVLNDKKGILICR